MAQIEVNILTSQNLNMIKTVQQEREANSI